MPVTILEPRKLHGLYVPATENHTPFRGMLLTDHDFCTIYRPIIQKIVEGRDVVEIGMGLFGGLAKLVLELGCHSYTGIEPTCRPEGKISLLGERDRHGCEPDFQTAEIKLPSAIVDDCRVNYIFGTDACAYLAGVPDNRVVTISTGFFHDVLLLLDDRHKKQPARYTYVEKMISEIARVSIPGAHAGFHDLLYDVASWDYGEKTFGKEFKKMFAQNGISVRGCIGISCNGEDYDHYYILQKPG